jgi:hypothetical protein
MGKFGRVMLDLMILGVTLPIVIGTYNMFTHPRTGGVGTGGILVEMVGVGTTGLALTDETLALVGIIPWALPLFILIWTVIDLTRPDKPAGFQ